jgi:hypothetical protein
MADPGIGYRLIDVTVDKPYPGDEFWLEEKEEWLPRWSPLSPFNPHIIYRRKQDESIHILGKDQI